MKIKLTERDEVMFKGLAQSETGKNLKDFFQRVIDTHADIRIQTEDLNIARKAVLAAQEMIEDNFINHLKTFSGEHQSNENDYR